MFPSTFSPKFSPGVEKSILRQQRLESYLKEDGQLSERVVLNPGGDTALRVVEKGIQDRLEQRMKYQNEGSYE